MKVVFCLRNFLPNNTAGTEVYVSALCEGLQKLGVETIVVKPGFDKSAITEYFYNSIRVIEYPESSKTTKDLILGKIATGGITFFRDILLKEKPDVIHFHEIGGSNGITTRHLRVCRQLKIPVFCTLHLAGYSCKTGTLKYKKRHDCEGLIDEYRCAVCVLYQRGLRYGIPEMLAAMGMAAEKINLRVSRFPESMVNALSYPGYIRTHKTVLEEIFLLSEKVFVLSNWFKKVLLINQMPETKMVLLDKALPHFSATPVTKTMHNAKNEKALTTAFVYLGRISRIKGLHIVLTALQDIKDDNWSLDIYGQAEEEEYLAECKHLSKENSSKICWKEILPPSEVVQRLTQYDALIFPTIIQEMVGLVVMEAFAANIPVIGSNVKGIAEQIKDGETGILFEPGNVKALRDILKKILIDPPLLGRLAANISMPAKFDDVALTSYMAYNSVMPGRAMQLL